MVDQPHIWESNPGLADNKGNHLRRSGKVWRNRLSPTRVGYRKSDWLLFSNMFKNRADQIMSPKVVLVVQGSSEGLLVSPALWELSSTLGSCRILSAAQSADDLA